MKQKRYAKVQGLWQQNKNKELSKMPVIKEGVHAGQKYDIQYIFWIHLNKC